MKAFFKAKTNWTGLGLIMAGLGQILMDGGDPTMGYQNIGIGLMAIFGRQAVSKNGLGK